MQNFKLKFALLVAISTSIACSSNDSKTSSNSQSTLDWQPCESVDQLECAELAVPMQYSQADGEQVSISLIRKPASGDDKQGALVFNPGGPGGSGIELIESIHETETIPDSILAAYDIVSFDPRGVGQSTPVICGEFGLDDFEEYPADAVAVNTLYDQYVGFAADCSQKYGSYLQHLGSLNVVRDIEEIRKAMGEDKLNFVGYSYGTRLAALYLQEFPESSGRIVLDASMHPDSSLVRLLQESLPVQESSIRSAVAQCLLIDSTCDVDEMMSVLTTRISTLADQQSEAAQFELSLIIELLSLFVEDPLFGTFAAQTTYDYLTTLDVGVLIDFGIELERLGVVGDDNDDTTIESVVMCADDADRPTSSSLVSLLASFNALSDIVAEAQIAQAAICANWPDALEPVPMIATSTAPMSLVIGGTTDALTPLAWSEAMAQAIGGLFIKSEHAGHTVLFTQSSACIDSIVERFLLDGLTPTQTQCVAGD